MIQSWAGILASQQVDGSALTAAAAASMLPGQAKYNLPAGFLQFIGQVLQIKASGRVSTVITTPGTIRFDVRFGAIVVFDGLAVLPDTVAAHTNVGWYLDILLTVRSVGNGTAATLFGQGTWTCEDILGVPATAPKGVLTAMLPWNSAPTVGNGFDSTTANTVDVFFTQTVATGSLTCHQYTLESKL